jgi:hypothetical protein
MSMLWTKDRTLFSSYLPQNLAFTKRTEEKLYPTNRKVCLAENLSVADALFSRARSENGSGESKVGQTLRPALFFEIVCKKYLT